MSDLVFWVGLAIGAGVGFGAGLILFLPIVWRQVDLEDNLDARKADLKATIGAIERIRDRLDDMIVKRERVLFDFLGQDNGMSSNPKDLAGDKMPRKMENYGRG
jgi:hypothetical protein